MNSTKILLDPPKHMVVEGGVFLLILDTGNVTVYSRLVPEMCFL